MKHHTHLIATAAVAALSAVSALAEKTTNTFTRTSSQASTITWGTAGLTNGITTTAGSDISIKIDYDEGGEKYQQLKTADSTKTAVVPIYIDSVIGGKYHNFSFVNPDNTGQKYVVINDPTPFEGFWSIADGPARASGIFLPDNNGAGPRTIGSAYVKGRFNFGVAAGCEAVVDYPFGIGMFEINRNMNSRAPTGKITVKRSPGPYSVVQVRAGTLEIVGGDNDTSSPVPGAWARFDASAEDSFTKNGTEITEWRDADGKPVSVTYESPLNKTKLELDEVTGKTLVNFGPRGGVSSSGGGSRLKFAETKDGIAEIFVVFRENNAAWYPAHLVGKAFPRPDTTPSNQLFVARGAMPKELAMGEIRLNGQAVVPDFAYNFSRELNVVSAGYRSGGGSVTFIGGTESANNASAGGARIAEILFYTNTLTAAERRHNNDYLMKKWLGRGIRDYGAIKLQSGTTLSVTSGTARVRELNLATSSFAKNGEGTLEIESVNRSLNTLDVNDGAVRFANTLSRPANPQPPADALAWFDASETDTMDIIVTNYISTVTGYSTNDVTCVTNWRDKRSNGYALQVPELAEVSTKDIFTNKNDQVAWPTLDTTTGEHPMVDLGPWMSPCSAGTKGHFGWINGISGLSTWLCLKKNGAFYKDSVTRQGFVVFYKTDSRGNPINSHGWDLRNAGNNEPMSKFIHDNYASTAALSGHWTYDGVTVNPANITLSADGKAHLGAFQFTDGKLAVDVFGSDWSGGNSSGGCKIAEVILYDRYLTEQERLDTERYLMKKWNCGTHPKDSVPSVGTLTFNNGTPAVIDTDVDMTIATVQCGTSGALAKKGTGTATVTQLTAGTAVSALTIEDGTLAATGNMTVADGAVVDVFFNEQGLLAGNVAITGTLTVSGSGTVRVHVPQGVTPQLGKYDILTATQVSGLSGNWTVLVVGEEIREKVSVGYDATRGAIFLNVSATGTVLVFR